jgi:hypothetical protein
MALTKESFKNDADWKDYLRQYVAQSAQARGIPVPLAFGVAEQESSWKPDKPGYPKNKSIDAGLMQVNSINWKDFGITKVEDVTGPNWQRGVDVGMDILKRYYVQNNGNIPNTLVAYNAGPGRLREFQATGNLPEITRDYVPTVVARMQKWGGAPLAQGDFDALYAQFKPTRSQEKTLQAAGLSGPQSEQIKAAANRSLQKLGIQAAQAQPAQAAPPRAPQPAPMESLHNFNLLSADAGNDPYGAPQQQGAQPQPEPQQVATAPQPDLFAVQLPAMPEQPKAQKRDLAALRRELDSVFNADQEAEMSGPMASYLSGIV